MTTPADRLSDLRSRLGTAHAPHRLELLREYQNWSWQTGDRIPAEELVALLPQCTDEDSLVLIWGEVKLRQERNEAPTAIEYRVRFPKLAAHIDRQFELEQLLCDPVASTVPRSDGARVVMGLHGSPPGYVVFGKQGEGAMGVVYRACQISLNRTVALKMMWGEGPAQSRWSTRFRQEAELAARLQHPNIVQVYEFGPTTGGAGPAFLAMEFVDGQTLAQKCAGVPLPVRDAALLIETLSAAVHYAHQHGVVHRDLKPSNILLTPDGVPKVADFGLAKEITGGSGQTSSGHLLGTPAYMAPEQAAGHNDRVGPATDVWALGAILYELLTGRPPFRGESPLDTLARVLHDPPEPPARLRPDMPRDLQTVCLKCLEKDAARRYPTTAALADDLGRFLAGRPVQARPVPAWERCWRWCARNRPLAAALAVVAALLVAVTLGSMVAAIRLGREADRATAAERAQAEQLFRSVLNDARSMRRGAQPGRRVDALARIREASRLARERNMPTETFRELRDEALACLTLFDLAPVREMPTDEAMAQVPVEKADRTHALLGEGSLLAVSPDLKHVLCWDAGKGLVLYHADTFLTDRSLEAAIGPDCWPAFSPDSRFLIARIKADTPSVALWDLHDPRPTPKHIFAGYTTGTATCHPFRHDSRVVAIANGTEVGLYDTVSGEALQRLPGFHDVRVAFDPAGDRLAVAERHGELVVIDLATGHRTTAAGVGAPFEDPAWSADGRLLAIGRSRSVFVFETLPQREPRLVSELTGHQSLSVRTRFIPGTPFLLSNCWDGVVRVWDPVAGRQVLQCQGFFWQCVPDGSRLVVRAGPRLREYRIVASPEAHILYHGAAGNVAGGAFADLNSVSFAATGRVLVTGGPDGARFWDPERGREIDEPLALRGGCAAQFVGRDDRALLTSGPSGYLWWPRVRDDGVLRFGPPRPLELRPSPVVTSATPDGEWVSLTSSREGPAVVRHTDDPVRRVVLGSNVAFDFRALSPDGKFLAVSGWKEPDVLVWEVATGRLVHRVSGSSMWAGFSPDGRRLVTREFENEMRLWDTDGWKLVSRFRDGRFAFSADSRLLAVATGYGKVCLLDGHDGTQLVTLEAPDSAPVLKDMAFSPDGRYLAAGTSEQSAVVWDLVALRNGLVELGLEWELTAPPVIVGPVSAIRIDYSELAALGPCLLANEQVRLRAKLANEGGAGVRFELGLLALAQHEYRPALDQLALVADAAPEAPIIARARFIAAAALKRWSDADAAAEQLTRLRPDDADTWLFHAKARRHLDSSADIAVDLERLVQTIGDSPVRLNSFAWQLIQTDPEIRDPKCGVSLASRAIALDARPPAYWNTLGIGLYRTRDYMGAVDALTRSSTGGGVPAAFDLFPLALCYHHLGRAEAARETYRRALSKVATETRDYPHERRTLDALRTEAETVLGQPPGDNR
jgi:WD40 repeat protein/tetratricopeptide (TPR) repeat protein